MRKHTDDLNPWDAADLCGDPGPVAKKHKNDFTAGDLDKLAKALHRVSRYFGAGGECRQKVDAAREVILDLHDLWIRDNAGRAKR